MSKRRVSFNQSHVLLRNMSRDYPVIDRGRGVTLIDTAGKKYFDASGGALVSTLGHGNKAIAKAVHSQLTRVAYVNGQHFTNDAAETLANMLAARAKKIDPRLNRSFFLSSGSEANEAAFKFVRQCMVERGKASKHRFIARTPGYHGNTLFALSASGRPHYRKVFGPMLSDVTLIEAPYPYRSNVAKVGDYKKDGAAYYAKQLEDAIVRLGPESVAGFVAEPVIGSSAGASPPPPGYFEKIREICDRFDIRLIADEVMCGAGRTGTFFASEQVGLRPDVILLGKGLSAGYIPLSAVIVRDDHLEDIRTGSGNVAHAQTYLQAPSMCSAGVAALKEMDRLKVLANVRRLAPKFKKGLEQACLHHPHVGSIQGMGFMVGVEFVENKSTKAPFERTAKVAERLIEHAMEHGLILWPNVGHADGHRGDLIMLGPPLTMNEKEMRTLIALVSRVLETFTFQAQP